VRGRIRGVLISPDPAVAGVSSGNGFKGYNFDYHWNSGSTLKPSGSSQACVAYLLTIIHRCTWTPFGCWRCCSQLERGWKIRSWLQVRVLPRSLTPTTWGFFLLLSPIYVAVGCVSPVIPDLGIMLVKQRLDRKYLGMYLLPRNKNSNINCKTSNRIRIKRLVLSIAKNLLEAYR